MNFENVMMTGIISGKKIDDGLFRTIPIQMNDNFDAVKAVRRHI